MNAIDKYKSHKWVRKVINSCTNDVQLDNCENLIRNFERLYGDDLLVKDLQMHITDKMMFRLLYIPKPWFQTTINKGHFMTTLDYLYETE